MEIETPVRPAERDVVLARLGRRGPAAERGERAAELGEVGVDGALESESWETTTCAKGVSEGTGMGWGSAPW